MNKKIVVVGSSNTDMIIKVPRIPKPGETIIAGTFSMAAGGKGANQAVAAARAGGEVAFVARVGDDMFGKQAIDGFRKDNIDVHNVIHDSEAPSGVALIFVDKGGENSIAVASGANANLSPSDIQAVRDVIASANILLMQLETPIETVELASAVAVENRVKVILNPAPARKLGDDLLKRVSILTPNESEAELLTGISVTDVDSAKKAARILLDKGTETVIITLGRNGALLATPEYSERISGFKVKAVDATAAGDVFNGALTVALAENRSPKDALVFANAAAALSVTKLGAQPSAPYRKEIEEFIKN